MAKYRLKRDVYVGNAIRPAGSIIDTAQVKINGKPGSAYELIEEKPAPPKAFVPPKGKANRDFD
jgi:hypothetical protein